MKPSIEANPNEERKDVRLQSWQRLCHGKLRAQEDESAARRPKALIASSPTVLKPMEKEGEGTAFRDALSRPILDLTSHNAGLEGLLPPG
jgi:hypothetical protein